MRLIPVFFLFISLTGNCQWKNYILSVRGDTLNRIDMKDRKQGPWVINVPDLRGERGYEEEGYFENDLKEGSWKKFSLEGVKIAEETYRWGKLHGRQQYFTYNGGLLREESWRAIDPANAYDTVPVYDLRDPSKILTMAVVKNDGVAMKHGKWLYYDPREGTIEATEVYVMNKLQTDDGSMLNDDEIRPVAISQGKQKTDTAGLKTTQKPQVILDYEKKNSGKKKIKVRDGNTGNLPKP
jgi:antitoxin component YwqK of YwqJK toxin-antitoxin module